MIKISAWIQAYQSVKLARGAVRNAGDVLQFPNMHPDEGARADIDCLECEGKGTADPQTGLCKECTSTSTMKYTVNVVFEGVSEKHDVSVEQLPSLMEALAQEYNDGEPLSKVRVPRKWSEKAPDPGPDGMFSIDRTPISEPTHYDVYDGGNEHGNVVVVVQKSNL